jgi:hypothetical protein
MTERQAIKSVNPITQTVEFGCFVTNSNVSPQRTAHKDAPASPLRDIGARNIGRRFRSAVVGRARSAYACPALTPPGTRAPSRAIRRHTSARGRYTRARWTSVPIVHQHRLPTIGAIQRLFGARVSAEPPNPTSAIPHCPGNFPLAQCQKSLIAQVVFPRWPKARKPPLPNEFAVLPIPHDPKERRKPRRPKKMLDARKCGNTERPANP